MQFPIWHKQGLIYSRNGGNFFKSHAMRVIPYLRRNGDLRLFFSSRCAEDMMHPTFIDVDPEDPKTILGINEVPLMKIGEPGTFDDSGITLASIVNTEIGDFCYYTGWKRRRYGGVGFELSIGIAEILDDGDKLLKLYDGPILAQNKNHPFLVAGPFVINDSSKFRMWFCSATSWTAGENGLEPIYTVFHATSDDGVNWNADNRESLINYKFDGEVISAPWVIKVHDRYLMYYPHRGSANRQAKNYTIGMAESSDGLRWRRLDQLAGISRSTDVGWDSEMICYPAIFNNGDKTYMFYSGNAVGKGGIGYAIADRQLPISTW